MKMGIKLARKGKGFNTPVKKTKKRRSKPGSKSIRQIKKFQRSTENLIPKATFQRLAREIACRLHSDLRFEKNALLALQEASESYMTRLFAKSTLCTLHAKRVTLNESDLVLVRKIRN